MISASLDIIDIASSESLALICLEALKLIGAWRENCRFSVFCAIFTRPKPMGFGFYRKR